MKKLVACGFLVMVCVSAMAATTRYVVPPGGGNTPGSGYTSWATAATNIQDAVGVAGAGDTVLVTNGVYLLANQITVSNLTIRSENNGTNDPLGTIINGNNYVGKGVTNRCFTLSHSNAVVEGFTITGGSVVSNNCLGGGVYISAGTLRNCLVTGNLATNNTVGGSQGGGVYATGASSMITNCDITSNTVWYLGVGGGVYLAASAQMWNSRIMYNGTPATNVVVGLYVFGGGVYLTGTNTWVVNSVIRSNAIPQGASNYGGGVHVQSGGVLRNCLIGGNLAYSGGGVSISAVNTNTVVEFQNCTILGNSASYHGGGIMSAVNGYTGVLYRASGVILSYNQPEDFYYQTATTTGLFYYSLSSVSGLAGTGNIVGGPAFMSSASGDYRLTPWSRGVDAGLWQSWMTNATDLAGQPRLSANNLPDMGAYETTAGTPTIHYVANSGQTPVSPYTNGWTSAASNIQDVLNVMSDGETILVKNGVYTLTNQIITGYATIRSDNNGAVDRDGTIINGNYPNATNRCFTLNHADAVVEGFTITNGFVSGTNGGGVYMTAGTLRNCLVTGNTATNGIQGPTTRGGGGVYATGSSSLITNCQIIGNSVFMPEGANMGVSGGGGLMILSGAQVWNSLIMYNQSPLYASAGGGVTCEGGSVFHSSIISNKLGTTYAAGTAWGGGGVWVRGAVGNTFRNCLIAGNGAGALNKGTGVGAHGGGASMENCTIVDNFGSGIGAGSATSYKIWNTISYYNSAVDTASGGTFIASNSCMTSTTNLTAGSTNNIITPPQFVNRSGRNYRLTKTSPCVNAGVNQAWMTGAGDLDGMRRISPKIGGTVDMGAYEYDFPATGWSLTIQ